MHITTITPISKAVGANRICLGVSIPHPVGEVELPKEQERKARLEQIKRALLTLTEDISEQTIF